MTGTVAVYDSSANTQPRLSNVTIGTSGQYSATVTGFSAPFLLQATGQVGGQGATVTYYSMAMAAGTVNITPLTSLMVLNIASGNLKSLMSGSSGGLPAVTSSDLKAQNSNVDTLLAALLQPTGLSSGYDFIGGTIAVGGGGYDQLLDDLTINLANPAAVTVANNTDPGAPVTVNTDSGTPGGTLTIIGSPTTVPIGTLGTADVPNVVGDTQAVAATAIVGAGLAVGTVTQQASSTVPSGDVISESPAAGTSVTTSSSVNLLLSSGASSIAVPNVVGETQAAASTSLAGVGLTVGTVTPTSSTNLAAGDVVSESPAAGSFVVAGAAINLTVAALPFTAITATMTSARSGHTATLLADGQVLIAGGCPAIPCTDLSSAEIYNPATQTFTALSSVMTVGREGAAATLLPSGKVLITGGAENGGSGTVPLDSAELYDPVANTFTSLTATMTEPRFGHTATLLANGTVLITGGYSNESSTNPDLPVTWNNAEIYDPIANTFTAITATMAVGRAQHTATLLANGKVLIAGGTCEAPNTGVVSSCNDTALAPFQSVDLDTAEVYDTVASTFTALGATMTSKRDGAAAALLPSGQVLLAGGLTGQFGKTTVTILDTAELYNPTTGTFTALTGTMTMTRGLFTATLLPNGQVLLAGGIVSPTPIATNTAELYSP
ncbi:MAG: PASTA domain-containing protein [Steroidobacteraceae bacterium]